MNAIKDLAMQQKQWADSYRNVLIKYGVDTKDANREYSRQLSLLRNQNINPNSDDWQSPEEAANKYHQNHQLPKMESKKKNFWEIVEYQCKLLTALVIWVFIWNLIEGKLGWFTPITPKFLLALPLTLTIIICFTITFLVHQKYGFLKTIPIILLVAALTLALPFSQLFWGDMLKVSYGNFPTIMLVFFITVSLLAVKQFAKNQSKHHKNRLLLQTWEQFKTGDLRTLNKAWFAELEFTLRNSYHYSNKMITQTLPDLRIHLAEISNGKELASAEEEFGSVSDFAYELAQNNHQAIVKTRLFNLVAPVVYLIFSIISVIIGLLSLFTEGNSISNWIIISFAILLLVISVTSTYSRLREIQGIRHRR